MLLGDALGAIASTDAQQELAARLLASPKYTDGIAIAATARALSPRSPSGDEVHPRLDRLVMMALRCPLTSERAMRALPVERRWALIAPLGLGFQIRASTEQELDPCWSCIGLCPTTAWVMKVLAAVREWGSPPDAPRDRAVAVLRAMGATIIPTLRKARASADAGEREVIDRLSSGSWARGSSGARRTSTSDS